MNPMLEIRAVQLDLARQMEPWEFIRDFIDFIAANDCNALFLYLEWRVRTRVFDIGAGEGYSAAELGRIVDYADRRGIGVIPGFAALGHAELVLGREEYAGYGELRGGLAGRFGQRHQHCFCPSLPEVRSFLGDYLREAAGMFPSPYLHIGGDEAWDIGFCPLCRERCATLEGEEQLYLDHFQFCHDLVAGELGKRMLMWDDMFEYYPEALRQLPRDIVLVDWQYQANVTGYAGHFKNREFSDRLARYHELGFDFLIAPTDYHWSNTESMTGSSRGKQPLGGLLTLWEKSASFLHHSYPIIAGAGRLWNGEGGDEALRRGIVELFGCDDALFVQGIAQFVTDTRQPPSSGLSLRAMGFDGPDYRILESLKTLSMLLEQYAGRIAREPGRRVLDDIINECARQQLALRGQIACWRMRHGLPHESIAALAGEIDALQRRYEGHCRAWRRPADVAHFEEHFTQWRRALLDYRESFAGMGRLECLFFLPDAYGAERLDIEIKTRGSWRSVAAGVFKKDAEACYWYSFFIPAGEALEAVRISARGFGGQGVCYVQGHTARGEYLSQAVTAVSGRVADPEHLLTPDTTWCYLGSPKTADGFRDRRAALEANTVEITMI